MKQLGAGEIVAGRYRLTNVIGGGGMGTVWRARHCTLDLDVAVKFMSTELLGRHAGETRFRREARSAAQLKSPHIVVVHDYGMHGAQPYLVMELLEGEDLSSRLARVGRLSLEQAARIIDQVAKALAVAHHAGIVHRDLKPANLFLVQVGGQEVIKVLDFGIAKRAEPHTPETSSGILLGSPSYLSPEQARGLALDARSDLWSLGVIAYEMLVGARPFEGVSNGDLVVKICAEDPRAPSTLVSGLSPALDEFFATALSRAKSQRFASAEELARAFSAISERAWESSHGVTVEDAAGVEVATPVGPGRSAATQPLSDTLASATTAARTGGGRRAFTLGLGALAVASVAVVVRLPPSRSAHDPSPVSTLTHDPSPEPKLARDATRPPASPISSSASSAPARLQAAPAQAAGLASAAAPPGAIPKGPPSRAPARTRAPSRQKPALRAASSAEQVMDPEFGVPVTRGVGSAVSP